METSKAVIIKEQQQQQQHQQLVMPLACLRWLALEPAPEADPELCDAGWMVRPLSAAGERAVAELVGASERGDFLVFGVDGF